MPLLETRQERAALFILILAVTVAIGLGPFFSGLLGAAVLYVVLARPFFWGAVTAFASVLPVFGSGLVWLPATLILLAQGRLGAAATMLVIGGGIASNVDSLIRPLVYKRVSDIHPMITLVGALAGVRYFGLLGILLGPLAIAYLFELLQAYREEYGVANGDAAAIPAMRTAHQADELSPQPSPANA